jgi:hypothetical protein
MAKVLTWFQPQIAVSDVETAPVYTLRVVPWTKVDDTDPDYTCSGSLAGTPRPLTAAELGMTLQAWLDQIQAECEA